MITGVKEPVMTVYGAAWCPHCKRVKKFLAAHRVRYTNIDIDAQPEAIERLKELQDGGQIIPTVVYPDGMHEVNPSDEALARRIGLTRAADQVRLRPGHRRGRARRAGGRHLRGPGRHRRHSHRSQRPRRPGRDQRPDRQLPGVPRRHPGGELADRFVAQARRYRVELVSAVSVTAVERDHDDLVTSLSSGQQLTSHAVIVATGSTYRRLDVPGEEELIGAGVHFCATCDATLLSRAPTRSS